jgi:hypothetical protein
VVVGKAHSAVERQSEIEMGKGELNVALSCVANAKVAMLGGLTLDAPELFVVG